MADLLALRNGGGPAPGHPQLGPPVTGVVHPGSEQPAGGLDGDGHLYEGGDDEAQDPHHGHDDQHYGHRPFHGTGVQVWIGLQVHQPGFGHGPPSGSVAAEGRGVGTETSARLGRPWRRR